MKNLFTLTVVILLSHFSATSLPNPHSFTGDFAQLRSNLYIVAPDGSTVLMDGSLTQYYADYSNVMDGMDARKMTNPSENWGMIRNKTVYVIERRHTIEKSDSIFFKMWNMRVITYRIELIASNLNFPGRKGILKDKFLNTSTPVDLNGNTYVDFAVTSDPASKEADRFTLIFSNDVPKGMLPLSYASLNAFEKDNAVIVGWKTLNENNVKEFNIERSADGIHFNQANMVKANSLALNNYRWIDNSPRQGNNYYRISGVGADGKTAYSNVMKVYVGNENESMSIYPNPAKADNFNLRISNGQPGLYKIRLINSFGQISLSKEIQYAGGSSIQKLEPRSPAKGIYQLEITSPDGSRKVISVMF